MRRKHYAQRQSELTSRKRGVMLWFDFSFSSTPIYHMIGHVVPYDTLLTPSGRITNNLSQRLTVATWAQSTNIIARVAELTIPWKASRIRCVTRHEDVACSVVYKSLIDTQRR